MERRPRKYKSWIEPGSRTPIPLSTWHRYTKRHRSQDQEFMPRSRTDYNTEVVATNEDLVPDITADTVPQVDTESDTASTVSIADVETDCEMPEDKASEVNALIGDQFTPSSVVHEVVSSLWRDTDILHRTIDVKAEFERDRERVDDDCMHNFGHEDWFWNADAEQDATAEWDNAAECSSLQQNTTLEEAINSGSLKRQVSASLSKTIGEVVLMILKFVLVHALSLTQTTDLFRLINSVYGEPFLPDTRYLIDKLFYPKNNLKLYGLCPTCGFGLGRFERADLHVPCDYCKSVVYVKEYSYTDFFVLLNVASPIAKLIESNSEYYKNIVQNRVHDDHIRDIYDGKLYIDFINKLASTDAKSYATAIFNTDGAPLFESSSYSIWPIFLMINELPYNVRTKELILAGLWFGKDKPNMLSFLEPFVDDLNELADRGVECTIDGEELRIKVFTLVCCVDAVARAPIQGFTQFNGAYGCGQCLHPGEWVRGNANNPRSGSMKYPLLDHVPNDRNVNDTIEHMRQSLLSGDPVFGVKNTSALINLRCYNAIDGNVVESMHCISGVGKQFATIFYGNKNKTGLLSRKQRKELDERIKQIKVPHQVSRLARSLSEKEFWKAREWENWILFYSIPVLSGILPDYSLLHWSLLVEGFHILSQREIAHCDVDRADRLLREFVGQTEIFYGKSAMTFNVHSLIHLAKSVMNWGPLWSHNAYAFESGNGELLKVIHAAQGVHHQICRRISLKYSFMIIKDHVYPFSSSVVRNFCDTLGSTRAKHANRPNVIRYFGSVSRVSERWVHKLNLGELCVAYKKIVKNSCIYMSALQNNKRSDNSWALLTDKSYVQLISFIVDFESRHEYAIVRRVRTTNAHDDKYPMLKKIVSIDDNTSAISTMAIDKICVHVSFNNKYLCAVPNLYYY